jgi:hypothetical protein
MKICGGGRLPHFAQWRWLKHHKADLGLVRPPLMTKMRVAEATSKGLGGGSVTLITS